MLSTIGQAFELRYKLYLNQPTPNPLAIPEELVGNDENTCLILFNSFDGDTWGSHLPMHKEQPPGVPERKVQSIRAHNIDV